MRYAIRELKIGEILDQAVNLTKDHFGVLIGITAVLLIPFYVIGGLIQVAMTPPLPPNPTPEQVMAARLATCRVLDTVRPAGWLRHHPDYERRPHLRDLQCLPREADQCGRIIQAGLSADSPAHRHLVPRRSGHHGRHDPLPRSWNPRRILVCSGNTGGRHRGRGGIRGHEAEQAVNGRQYRDRFRVGAAATSSLTAESASGST